MFLVNGGVDTTPIVKRDVEQLHTTLKRYCLSLTASHWEADDLAQDSWLKAINSSQSLDHLNLEAYLLRIAKNTWIDRTRRQSTLTRILKTEQPRAALPDTGNLEIESAFQALITHLSPLQRAVFLLRDVFGYSIAETAGRLETTEGAVKAALHRARQSLPTVKDDMEKGLPLSEDESLKTYLAWLASAYQSGDVAALLALVQRNEMEPAMAIGVLRNRRIQSPLASVRDIIGKASSVSPSMFMAA